MRPSVPFLADRLQVGLGLFLSGVTGFEDFKRVARTLGLYAIGSGRKVGVVLSDGFKLLVELVGGDGEGDVGVLVVGIKPDGILRTTIGGNIVAGRYVIFRYVQVFELAMVRIFRYDDFAS